MMKLRKTLYFVLCFMVSVCTLSGCIEEYEADISADDSNLLVVEGAICSKQNRFYLSRTQAINSSYVPKVVSEAKVIVRGNDGSEYAAQYDGEYYSCWIEALASDVEYYLHIEVDGEVYESEPQKPIPTEKIAEVNAVQDTPESNIDVLVTPEAPLNPNQENYYSWSFDETWEVHPDYTTYIYFDPLTLTAVYDPYQFPERGWMYARTSSILVGESQNYEGHHIEKFKLYDISRSSERIFHKYSGLVHQRAISKDEYEYELARRQAVSEMGGLFTPQPSALPTNIHCLTSGKHVIGYVGCSLNTAEYRFFLRAHELSIDRPYQKDSRTWIDDCNEATCLLMLERGLFLCEWNDDRMIPGGTLRTAWATQYQLDVRLRGASVEEPEYWHLNESISY